MEKLLQRLRVKNGFTAIIKEGYKKKMRIIAERTGKRIAGMVAAFAVSLLLFGGSSLTALAADITMNTNAKVRSEASTDSSVVGNVASGTTLSVEGEVTGADGKVWYQVSVGGAKGYVRSDLANKSSGNMTQEEVERENSYTETSATVSDTNVTSATVSTSSANIRKGPSSSDAPVTSAKSGTELTVTGEAAGADGKTWYQVSVNGKTGFIRSDLVEPVVTESTDTPSEEDSSEGDAETEGEAGSEEIPVDESAGTTEISNVISSRVLPGDADIENMTIDADTLASWESGNYYILYTKDADGGDSWYLYSLSDNQFEKIDDLHGGNQTKESSGAADSLLSGSNKLIVIIVIVLFVVLILVCILLAVKLHEYRSYGYEDDDEEGDDDDEEDDDDEDEDDEDDDEDEDDDDDEDEDDDEEDEDEDDEDDRRRGRRAVKKKKRWSPKNFLARHDDEDDEDDEDEDDDDDDDDDEEEAYLDDDDFEFEFLNMDGKDKLK